MIRIFTFLLCLACIEHLHAQDFKLLGPPDSVSNIATHGQVNCMAFDPTDSLRMWAGTKGGLWYSSNGGRAWSSLKVDTLKVTTVSDIALVPGSKDSLYVALGDKDYDHKSVLGTFHWWYSNNYYSVEGACYLSPDNGSHWTQVLFDPSTGGSGSEPNQSMNCLAAPQTLSDKWLIGSDWGMYRSTVSSKITTTNNYSALQDIKRKPGSANVVYATSLGDVSKSVDSGKTYTVLNITTGTIQCRVQLAVCTAAPSLVYALYSDQNGSFKGLFRSTDEGTTWEQRSSTPNILCPYNTGFGTNGGGMSCLSLTVCPTNPDIIYAGSVLVWRSTDAGKTWQCVCDPDYHSTRYVSAMIHQLRFSPAQQNVLYASTSNGIFQTRDSGTTWMALSNGIHAANISTVCASGFDDSLLFAVSPIGTFRCDHGTWSKLFDSASVEVRCSRAAPEKVFLVTSYGYQLLSTDSGKTFKQYRSPLDCTPGIDPHPYYQSTLRPLLMFANLKKMYVSFDEGKNWTQLYLQSGQSILSLTLSDIDSNTLYALTADSYLWKSTDAGQTWTSSAQLPLSSLPYGVCFRPQTSTTILAYSKTDFKVSHDGGSTYNYIFNDIRASTKNAIVKSVFWKRDGCSENLFLGTNHGVYKTHWDDLILNIDSLYSGLPNSDIRSFHLSGKELYVVTNGFGVYQAHFTDAVPRPRFSISQDTACPDQIITVQDQTEFEAGTSWNFDSGFPASSTQRTSEVSFPSGGDHSIRLNVKGCGLDTMLQKTIHILPRQKAKLSLSNSDPCVGDTLLVSDISTMSFEQRTLLLNAHDTVQASGDVFALPCTKAGNFNLHFLRSNRCSADSTDKSYVVHDAPLAPKVNVTGDTLQCSDASLVSYQWYFNGVAISGATSARYIVKVEGNYTVKARNTAGCAALSETVHVTPSTMSVAFNDTSTLSLYPNPCQDVLYLHVPTELFNDKLNTAPFIEVLNLLGERMQTVSLESIQLEQVAISTAELSTGHYFIRVHSAAWTHIIGFTKL